MTDRFTLAQPLTESANRVRPSRPFSRSNPCRVRSGCPANRDGGDRQPDRGVEPPTAGPAGDDRQTDQSRGGRRAQPAASMWFARPTSGITTKATPVNSLTRSVWCCVDAGWARRPGCPALFAEQGDGVVLTPGDRRSKRGCQRDWDRRWLGPPRSTRYRHKRGEP